MTTNEEKQLGRAKNAVLTFMENRLIVPKIYLNAEWGGHQVDVLAIERDGVGDVHAVILFARKYSADGCLDLESQQETANDLIERFSSIPANYKYIAGVDIENNHFVARFGIGIDERLFSPDFIGRIGLLHVDTSTEDDPKIHYVLGAERFRAKIAKLADEYVHQHEADWEIRA
jgi:hypothetical protein